MSNTTEIAAEFFKKLSETGDATHQGYLYFCCCCANPERMKLFMDEINQALQVQLNQEQEPDGWISYTTGVCTGLDECGNPKYSDRKFYRCPKCRNGTAMQTNYCANCGIRLSKYIPVKPKEEII